MTEPPRRRVNAIFFDNFVMTAVTRFIQYYKLIPYGIAFLLVIASLVQLLEMVFQKQTPVPYASLGIGLPLIVVNHVTLGHADAFASKNAPPAVDCRQSPQLQRERLARFGLHANAQIQARHLRHFCQVDTKGQKLLEMFSDRLGLSARTYTRFRKVALIRADLAGEGQIRQTHLAEAIQYRSLDRKTRGLAKSFADVSAPRKKPRCKSGAFCVSETIRFS